jgi:serine/threonine protein kinase/WD40 repeat protein
VDSLIGTTVGGYTLVSLLGSGGMGTVYLAEDPTIGQQVAIKVVRTDPDSLNDMGALSLAGERFKQEARAVASLDHLHILPLYRYGEEKTGSGQRAYMIMQYRPEGSLWDWLRRRAELAPGHAPGAQRSGARAAQGGPPQNGLWPLPLDEAGEYLRQAASALQYAHDRGIIHRDVKPANFLLRFESGSPVHLLLSDFGLAKIFSANSATSSVLGTPLYMAPEQFEGAAVPESDQYALAVMIYYLLAGQPPFDGEPMRLMHQHLSAPVPPIRNFNPALPEGSGIVLARAMAKRPADRYSSVAEFAAAFGQASQGQPDGATGGRPFLSLPTPAQGVRVSPTASTVAYPPTSTPPSTPQASQTQPAPQPVPSLFASPVPRPAQAISGGQSPPAQAESPQWAFSAPTSYSAPSGPDLLPPQPTAPSQPSQAPTTPARKRGLSRRGALGWILGGAAVAAVGGGAGFFFYSKFHTPDHALSVLQGHSDAVTSVSWSPGGLLLASGSRDRTAKLWQISSGQNTVTYRGHAAAVLSVAWRPVNAGVQLLASGGDDEIVQVWDTQARRRRMFPRLGASVSSVAWSLDGSYILAGTLGNGGHALPLSSGTVTKSLGRLDLHALAFSPDGSFIAAATESGFVSVITVQAPHKIVFSRSLSSAALSLAWSPDGTKLAAGFANNLAEVYAFSPGALSNGHVLHSLPHNGAVHGVAWEPATAATPGLATASDDGALNLWNLDSGARTIYNGYGPAMLSVAWSGAGLATGDANNTVILWQA